MLNPKHLIIAAILGFGEFSSVVQALKPGCTTNACYTAVSIGHNAGGIGACNSFFRKTVTPDPVTTTVLTTATTTSTSTRTKDVTTFTTTSTITASITTTVTSTVSTDTTTTTTLTIPGSGSNGKLRARDTTRTPTRIPPYASKHCENNSASYSSACHCIGATHHKVTAPTPTSTATLTVSTTTITKIKKHTTTISTDTSTVTSSTSTTTTTSTTFTTTHTSTVTECAQPQPTFNLLVSGGALDGDAAYVSSLDESGIVLFAGGDTGTPGQFTRNLACYLEDVDTNFIANTDNNLPSSEVFFNSNPEINSNNYDPIICLPSDNSNQSPDQCYAPSNSQNPTTLQTCGRSLFLGTSVGSECNAITLYESNVV